MWIGSVHPSAPSSILVKKKRDDVAGPSGRKKSKAPMSLCALRQVVGLGLTAGRLTIMQDVPPAPQTVKAPTTAQTPTTLSRLPPPTAVV